MKAYYADGGAKCLMGPGGIRCSCCNKYGGVKNARVAINRKSRRKNRQENKKGV